MVPLLTTKSFTLPSSKHGLDAGDVISFDLDFPDLPSQSISRQNRAATKKYFNEIEIKDDGQVKITGKEPMEDRPTMKIYDVSKELDSETKWYIDKTIANREAEKIDQDFAKRFVPVTLTYGKEEGDINENGENDSTSGNIA